MPDDQSSEPKAPYVIEEARSSRARCKTCRRKIDQGSLRLGMLIEGPFGPGYLWHHLKCAARRQLDRVEEAYRLEAWKQAREVPQTVPPLYTLRQLHEQAQEQRASRPTLPYVERAPSGRSRCKHCGQPIAQGSARVVIGRSVSFGREQRTTPINVHARCLAAALAAEDCATERAGLADALRVNSEIADSEIEAVLAEAGPL